jgi:N-acetylglucosaminyldiphosphoundecaprenol N-acetyl-beta-D-mannosaminyltransferase
MSAIDRKTSTTKSSATKSSTPKTSSAERPMPATGPREHEPGAADAPKTGRVLGFPVTAGTFDGVTSAIYDAAKSGETGYVCVANVHMLTTARHMPSLAEIVEHASFVTSDGMPLVWALKRKGFAGIERVYGPDLTVALCARAEADHVPIYLYGGSETALAAMVAELKRRFPRLRLVGAESPPMLPERPAFDPAVGERIRKTGARLVFVGLGCPKQEHWMAAHVEGIGAMLLGVGAAFDFVGGTVRSAPAWMKRAGLEWLFRLLSEPRRLFKRYLVTNSQFIYYVLRGEV